MPLHDAPCTWPQEGCSCPPVRREVPGPLRTDLTLAQTLMLMALDGYEVHFLPVERPQGVRLRAQRLFGADTVYCDRMLARGTVMDTRAETVLVELRHAWQAVESELSDRRHGHGRTRGTASAP